MPNAIPVNQLAELCAAHYGLDVSLMRRHGPGASRSVSTARRLFIAIASDHTMLSQEDMGVYLRMEAGSVSVSLRTHKRLLEDNAIYRRDYEYLLTALGVL